MEVLWGDKCERIVCVSDVRYETFPGGVTYPVSGVRTEYDLESGGKPWMRVRFKVDRERTIIGPVGGLPPETFVIKAPPECRVVDWDALTKGTATSSE
jgi:hypothetical protein